MSYNSKRIILGIGTGRCGTGSLVKLFREQKISEYNNSKDIKLSYIRHEGYLKNNNLIWYSDDNKKREYVKLYLDIVKHNLEKMYYVSDSHVYNSMDNNIESDILFHINVNCGLLSYLDEFFKQYENIRIICLKRDKKKTIESFLNLIKVYPESVLNLKRWNKDNSILPVYKEGSLEDNISDYYDKYYEMVEKIKNKYPDKIRCYNTETLFSSETEQREMLEFCGFENPCILLHIYENKNNF